MKEKEIENNILGWLTHVPSSKFWKNSSIGLWDNTKKVYRKSFNRHALNGVSDILGIKDGQFIAIEVKSKTGRPTESQKQFLEEITKLGGLAFIARSIDDVEVKFKEAGIL